MNYLTESTKTRELKVLMNILSEIGFESIKSFQKAFNLYPDGIFGNKSYGTLYTTLLNPIELPFDGYFNQKQDKNIILWHHSAGWDNARGMYQWWVEDGRIHVATSTGITDNGQLYRGFDEGDWAYHIGCKKADFARFGLPDISSQLERQSIGIEVCSAGSLDQNKKSWFGFQPSEDRIIELDYKGFKYYETITAREVRRLKYWTLLNAIRFEVPLYYREWDMWNLSKDALSGVPGIYTHNSFRSDKNDLSPQPHVIKMAKDLPMYYE